MGYRICIKPHLAHWGSGFSWRGEIAFETGAAWERFWEGYRSWILDLAAACKDADVFIVGTELEKMTGHEDAWRSLISEVRELTDARLTYAANWDRFEEVPFWDALDLIGIQSYFPIDETENPSEDDLKAGWAKLSNRLREYSKSKDRPVLLTELGYNRSFQAASRPWEYHVDGPEAEAFQSVCLSIALKAIESEPALRGVFLWKWFPHPRPVGRNFQLATPVLRRTISSVWMDKGDRESE